MKFVKDQPFIVLIVRKVEVAVILNQNTLKWAFHISDKYGASNSELFGENILVNFHLVKIFTFKYMFKF